MNPDESATEKKGTRKDARLEKAPTPATLDAQDRPTLSLESPTRETHDARARVHESTGAPPASVQAVPENLKEDDSSPRQSTQRRPKDDSSLLSENETAFQILHAEAIYTPPIEDGRESTCDEEGYYTTQEGPKPPDIPKRSRQASMHLSERSETDDSLPKVSFGAISFSDGLFKGKATRGGGKRSSLHPVLRKRDQSNGSSMGFECDAPVESAETGPPDSEKPEEAGPQRAATAPSDDSLDRSFPSVSEKQSKSTKVGAYLPEQDGVPNSSSIGKNGESSQRVGRRASDSLPEPGREGLNDALGKRRSSRTASILEQRRLLGSPGTAKDVNNRETLEPGTGGAPKGSARESPEPSRTNITPLRMLTGKHSTHWETITEPDVSVSDTQPSQDAGYDAGGSAEESDQRLSSASISYIVPGSSLTATKPRQVLRVKADISMNEELESPKRRPSKPVKIYIDSEVPSNKNMVAGKSIDEAELSAVASPVPLSEAGKGRVRSSVPVVPTVGTPGSVSPVASADERSGVISGDRAGERCSYHGRLLSSSSGFLSNIAAMAVSKRFFMLMLFCSCSMVNAFQWIEYAIISNIVSEHYGVSESTVAWTSQLYLLGYTILAFPSAWILDKFGLRVTVILGAMGTCIGACIKVMSVEPDRFALVLLGQSFPAFAQAFILGVPPRIASVWFKYEESSTACAAAVIGNQLGVALGFVIPPYLIDGANVESSLLVMCFGVAIISCLCSILVLVAFQDKPANPPSVTEMLNRYSKKELRYAQGLRRLVAIADFRLLLLSYGIITGVFYALSTLLNPVVLIYFPGEESLAGWLGMTLILSGLVGSWMCGTALDRTGNFKKVNTVVYVLSTVAMFAYAFVYALRSRVLAVLVCLFLGFFMTGYIPIGLQLGSEMTYPLPEGLTSNMLNVSAQAMGFVLILLSEYMHEWKGALAANLLVGFFMIFGCVVTALLKVQPKRQKAIRRANRKRLSSRSSMDMDQSDHSSKQK